MGLSARRDAAHRHRLPRGAKAGEAPLEGSGQADAAREERALRGKFAKKCLFPCLIFSRCFFKRAALHGGNFFIGRVVVSRVAHS